MMHGPLLAAFSIVEKKRFPAQFPPTSILRVTYQYPPSNLVRGHRGSQ